MTHTPKPIITSASLTQHISFDKVALAEWMQRTFESIQYSSFCSKTEIEPHVVQYKYDYEKMGEALDFVHTHMIADAQAKGDKSIYKGVKDAYITGKGADTALSVTINTEEFQKSQTITNQVTGLPSDAVLPAREKAVAQLIAAFKPSTQGLTVDGHKLLGALQSLIQMPAISEQPSLSWQERKHAREAVVHQTNAIFNTIMPGTSVSIHGDSFTLRIPIRSYVGLYPHLAAMAGLGSAVSKGAATAHDASFIIDYRQLVDAASDKARTLLADKKAATIAHIDDDRVDVILRQDGFAPMLNHLIEAGTAKLLASAHNLMPEETQHMGRLNEDTTKKRSAG